MKLPVLTLQPKAPKLKIGDTCPTLQPNVTESCILADPDGTQVGLFIKQLPDDLRNLINIADHEVNSTRVPKTMMDRKRPLPPAPTANAVTWSYPSTQPSLAACRPSRT